MEIFDIYPFRICTLLGTVPKRYRVEHSYQIRAESSGLLCRRAAPLCQFYEDKTWEPSARRKSKGLMSVIESGFLFVLSSARGGTRDLAHVRQSQMLSQRQSPRPGRGFFSTMFFSVSRLSRRNTLSRHILARGVYQPSSPPTPTRHSYIIILSPK